MTLELLSICPKMECRLYRLCRLLKIRSFHGLHPEFTGPNGRFT